MQCYYQNKETRCKNDAIDELEYWCSEEHKKLWQEENYKDKRSRGLRQLSPKEIQIGLLDIQIRLLRKKWVQAQDMFEKAEIEERGKALKEKRERLKNE